MAGTGLPIPKSGDVQTQPMNVVDADRYSTARDWGNIAAAGAKLSEGAFDALRASEHQQQVGYLAEQDTEITRKRIELRDQFASDPRGFDAAWKGYQDGKLGAAQPWAVNHLRKALGSEGNSAYSAILGERRERDQRLASEKVKTLVGQSANDVVGSAMAGTLNSDAGKVTIENYRNQLTAGVTSGLHTQEWADAHMDDTLGRANGEEAARSGVQVYRERGFDAAVEHLRKNILENENLSLKPEARYRAYSRGLQAIRLEKQQDNVDRAGIIDGAKDLKARIDSGQSYEPGEVRDTAAALARVGALGQQRQLLVADAVKSTTRGASLPQLRDAALGRRAAALDATTGAIVDEAARGAGVDPALMRRIAQIESGGRANAVTGSYKGLFQLSDADFTRRGGRNIFDARENATVAAGRLREEIDAFRQSYGREPSQTEIYLQHQQGVGGLRAHLSNPSAPAWQNMASTGEGRQKGETWAKAAIWGNIPNSQKAQFGSVENITSAQFVDLWRQRVEGGAPAAVTAAIDDGENRYAGEIAKQTQTVLVRSARESWPQFKSLIARGQRVDTEDFDAIRQAAALSGDRKWMEEVESAAVASRFGQAIEQLPEGQRQAALDQMRVELQGSNLSAVAQDVIQRSITQQFERQNKLVREDPVGYAIEQGWGPPAPLDLSSAAAANAGVADRVLIARGVAEDQGVAPSNPFRPADRATLAGAIATGKVEQAAVALNALANVPDEFLTAALGSKEIKDAVTGAARSTDGQRFNQAMLFMDRIWARAPETAKALFGEDNIHQLMTWQTHLRYMTPEQLAADRAKNANDPQIRERRKVNEQAGREIARKEYKLDAIVSQFDESWWITPGVIARNVTGAQPLPPVDPLARDALMGDFETLYARRYADTLDKDVALKQTIDLMKTKWTRSEVNGGRLMLNSPETLRDVNGKAVYPAIDGSWNWMTQQIESDLQRRIGTPRRVTVPGGIGVGIGANWSYELVPDRQTQAEAQGGRPPSYQVVVTDHTNGRAAVMPQRYAFDPTEAQARARSDFGDQRARVLSADDAARARAEERSAVRTRTLRRPTDALY